MVGFGEGGCEVTWRSAREVQPLEVEPWDGGGGRETVLGWRGSCEVIWWCAMEIKHLRLYTLSAAPKKTSSCTSMKMVEEAATRVPTSTS